MAPPGSPQFKFPPSGVQFTQIHPGSGADTAKAIQKIAKDCEGEACLQAQVDAGALLLADGDIGSAIGAFNNMAECASANHNLKYELLAKGLIALSEGRILNAQTDFQAIKDHPYAQRLLEVISHYDDQSVALETLHYLLNLVQEEKKSQPLHILTLTKIEKFIEEAIPIASNSNNVPLREILVNLEQSKPEYSGMNQEIEKLADGIGKELLRTAQLTNAERGLALFSLVQGKLIPSHHLGTAYLISKRYQKDSTYASPAKSLLLQYEGLNKDNRTIITDFLDNGATYFAASLLALGAGRLASRGVWALFTRGGAELSRLRWLLAGSSALAASTGTYFLTEKALLSFSGFDGKIWPQSGSELARELGADMIVMGVSNVVGGSLSWSSKRIFKPLSSKLPLVSRIARHTLRTPPRMVIWGASATLHSFLLYSVHRWEDNSGLIDRFRIGKSIALIPPAWVELEQNNLQILQAQKTLGKLLSSTSSQEQNIKSNEVYAQVHKLQRWMSQLAPQLAPDSEEAQRLLGIFWIAKTCGVLNQSAQDYLAKWMKEKRYNKVNDYFSRHQIPLQVAPQELIFMPAALPKNP